MNAKEFWEKVGTTTTKQVCVAAHTSFAYFCHIKQGRKSPSYAVAKRLADAGKSITGHQMDVIKLLESKKA